MSVVYLERLYGLDYKVILHEKFDWLGAVPSISG